MSDRMKNILIGLFVTGALSVMIVLVLFLKPTVGDGKKILQVRFANITGISIGTRVSFAGKPIGEVTHIQELPNAREEADDIGRIYLYQLTLKVDSSASIYSTDEIAIKTTGLMGEKSIAILPKIGTKAKPAELIVDQIIYANSTDPLENTFNQISKVAARLDRWVEDNGKKISTAVGSFDGAMGKVDAILSLVDSEKLIPNVRTSVDLLNGNLQLVHASLDDDQLLHKIANVATKLDKTAQHLNTYGAATLSNLNKISHEIASGSGTVGRLIAGDDFYLRVASLMSKGETLMNDINHYGVLFQYNKQWQKSRTKRANQLKALDTPQEFRNYFEGEIDTMTTALGRLSELMDRAGIEERGQILQSDAFRKDFASLLRQVQGLTDSLKLYNEGMVAQSTNE